MNTTTTTGPSELLDSIVTVLTEAKKVLVVAHLIPDGDTLGSLSALLSAFGAQGIEAVGCCDDAVPRIYRFLPGMEQVYRPESMPAGPFDVVVVVDCGDLGRVGNVRPWLEKADKVVNIDHHVGNTAFGQINWLDPSAAATGEMILTLIEHAQWPIDEQIATALYTSLVTDTGSFRFSNTTPMTMRRAALLRERGAEVNRITSEIYERRSLASLRILAAALPTMTLSADGRIAWLSVSISDMERFGAVQEDLEGLIDYPRSIDGVEIAILFRQLDAQHVKVGLRSTGAADVNAVARQFGGGGHRKAAGCTFIGGLEPAVAAVVPAVQQVLTPGPLER
ncbi:DHH family phosphoesterase [Heliophilum fasciatum]|uniref:Phosphoesterase RecJ-like protein n=1 Tax=Heliophilum fasciatum TaxID=35700 RepID=A0A4R2RQ66_9FIRM|nr:bifunctional oligoribonuclease/PAP phosphatase NrnA [Heliophilum fasciatum]MCW2277893.1 phosphoesterase RecJ-like protein [Heliophilum fasciatum]TCP64537.1 phosphoesterase RecJ-like protein [Heliophilum fasciatum]